MIFIPLYYQLLQAYHPIPYLPSPPTLILSIPTPTPTPTSISSLQVLGINQEPSAIGGETQFLSIALLGDSMIDTLPQHILLTSLQKSFPAVKFNIYDYGYGSTNIESGLLRLTQKSIYLSEDYPPILDLKPNFIVVESFAYNNFGNSTTGLEHQRQVLQQIVNTIKTKSPNTQIILAATIAPNSLNFADGIKNLSLTSLEKTEKSNTIKLYLQNLINFAQEFNLPLVDAYHPSLKNNEGLLELISNSDHLHPSTLGTEFFSDLLAQEIQSRQLIK
jgi:hypothetical protein